MYRDSLAASLCAHCAQYMLLVQNTTQLCMRYSKKRVLNTQPVLVAIEMLLQPSPWVIWNTFKNKRLDGTEVLCLYLNLNLNWCVCWWCIAEKILVQKQLDKANLPIARNRNRNRKMAVDKKQFDAMATGAGARAESCRLAHEQSQWWVLVTVMMDNQILYVWPELTIDHPQIGRCLFSATTGAIFIPKVACSPPEASPNFCMPNLAKFLKI
jgi:hypothetical protein